MKIPHLILILCLFSFGLRADHEDPVVGTETSGTLPGVSPSEQQLRTIEKWYAGKIKTEQCHQERAGTSLIAYVQALANKVGIVAAGPLTNSIIKIEEKLGIQSKSDAGLIPRLFNICMTLDSPVANETFKRLYGTPETMKFEERLIASERTLDPLAKVSREQWRAKLDIYDRVKALRNFIEMAYGIKLEKDEQYAAKFKLITGSVLPELSKTKPLAPELEQEFVKVLKTAEDELEKQYTLRLKQTRNPVLGTTPRTMKDRVDFIYKIYLANDPKS